MTIRPQRHGRKTAQGIARWDVERLIALSCDLVPFPKPLSEIAELDELWWFQFPDDPPPTPREIAHHVELARAADPSYPIILCAEGRLMDGMHRVLKALMAGQDTISAVQFAQTPEPDEFQENTR
ncbi:MAG: hypothetical protein AAFO93_01920 [Pseudomonadota bacterium]